MGIRVGVGVVMRVGVWVVDGGGGGRAGDGGIRLRPGHPRRLEQQVAANTKVDRGKRAWWG